MATQDRELVCHDCGTRTTDQSVRCECGEPLWFPVEAVDPPGGMPDSLWHYEDALPTTQPPGVGGAVGGTPLFRTPALDATAGCRVTLKDERANPTGSFKDRGSAVGVAVAASDEQPVLTVSHGNMARSVAAHATAAGVDCAVLVPADIPGDRLAPIARYDPALLRVKGDYGRLYQDAIDIVGPLALNSDVPLRVEGQKTVAYEIEAQASEVDAVVLPVSSGGNASAIWKAYRELALAGAIETPPRLYLIQASACDPIARAYREELSAVPAGDEDETIAYSIANPDPPSGARALRAARATDGAVIAVDDDAIRRAQADLATRAGVETEPAAATVLAGMHRLAASEEIRPTDNVVAIVTGTGLLKRPDAPPEAPVVEREAVSRALRDRFRG
jgi:threonine synthase